MRMSDWSSDVCSSDLIYARHGVTLSRSTLADWVAGSSQLLRPLVQALHRYVMGGNKVHADDTPVPVLAPGRGKTRTGRLWTYVRDDRAAASEQPAAVSSEEHTSELKSLMSISYA